MDEDAGDYQSSHLSYTKMALDDESEYPDLIPNFNFDDDVEPILSVLCGKTLEISRMEVLEEEELREMRE